MNRTADIVAAIDELDYSGFVVQPEYIDANGHMNVGYYTLLFDKAPHTRADEGGEFVGKFVE